MSFPRHTQRNPTKGTQVSNPRNAPRSLLHRLGVTGPARVRAFQGIGAPLRRYVLTVICASCGMLLLGVAPASALNRRPRILESAPFSQPSSFEHPTGVAVDQETGNVYVADSNADVVYVFGAEGGAPVGGVPAQINALDGLELVEGEPQGVAVDDACYYHGLSPTSTACGTLDPSNGDVYVEEELQGAIAKFKLNTLSGEYELAETLSVGGEPNGVAVNTEGNVYAVNYDEQAIFEFNSAGVKVGEIEQTTVENPAYVAVGAPGVVYVGNYGGGVAKVEVNTSTDAIDHEEALGTAGEGNAVAVNSHGNVYVDDGSFISGYDSAGVLIEEFGSGSFEESQGIAVNSETGDAYVSSNRSSGNLVVFGPSVVLPDVTTEAPSAVKQTSVTLHGTVNPEGTEVTACEFDYGTSTSYGQSKPCSKTVPFSGNSAEPVSAGVAELQSGTVYYFRLTATNSSGTEESAGSFTTPGPTVNAEWTSNVTSTSADLHAQIDPRGAETSYYFQYGTASCAVSPSACSDVPATPGVNIGSGEAVQSVVQHLQGLAPDTTYHYSVVTIQDSEMAAGPDHTFTTQTAGGESVLPDGREWEMVTPLNKDGAEPNPMLEGGGAVQASEVGGAIAYTASGPIPADSEFEGTVSPNASQVLSVRDGVDGWVSQDIMPPTSEPDGLSVGDGQTYKLFSPDLALGLLKPFTGGQDLAKPPLSPALSPGEVQEKTVSLRDDAPLAPEESEAASYDAAKRNGELMRNAGYVALLNAQNAPGIPTAELGVEGATPDLSHVVFNANEEVGAPLRGELYEWGSGGDLQPVSVLPGQTSEGTGVLGGGENEGAMTRHAISNDGTLVFWTGYTRAEGSELYVRDTETQETLRLDTVQGGSGEGAEDGEPFFWTASANGSKVFFTDQKQLTAGSKAEEGNPDLYVFELTSGSSEPLAGTLTDLTPGGGVQGVLGASEDGSYVYFVANGVLGDGAERGATQGSCKGESAGVTCNLYEYHDGVTTFIATLSNEDSFDWGRVPELYRMTSRVSPNGRYVAFMSDRSLTGYDNTDMNSGVADEEVFLYEAGTGTGRLVCASCNPTGARPEGEQAGSGYGEPAERVDSNRTWSGRWLAASVPTWTPEKPGVAFYQSRYLSNSGRLFFNSPDHLLPAATGDKEKVYEYEPRGEGSCASEAGCVGLISSGTSEHEAAFLDANASGSEVFFLSADRLAPQDTDNAYDVYDAHECTSASPCPPGAGTVPPACTTAESCRAAPAPQPEIFGAPPSQTFSGSGNIAPVSSKAVTPPKTAAQVRAEKLAKALKACKKKAKKKRAGCEKQARKRYGAKTKKKAKAKAKKSTGRGK